MQLDSATAFIVLGDEAFVSLTTFRKNGERVATPVWVARDGDALVVITPEESAKVKRLRANRRVELRPCSRMSTVTDGSEPTPGNAEIVTDATTTARFTRMIQQKYRLEYHIVMLIEWIAARRRKPRVIVRITAAAPPR